jgi:transcriptional regulator with XRE-family HTH domain
VALLEPESSNLYMVTKHPNLVKIGKKIRDARKAKGFSQEDFGAVARLGRTYMGRIERGEQNISIQNLITISIALKMEVGDLIPALKELALPRKTSSRSE